MSKNNDIINLAPAAIKVALKAIKFAKGGFTKEEKQELGQDLLALALALLTELSEDEAE